MLKNIDSIQVGDNVVRCWYFSPYPTDAIAGRHVYICDFCLMYFSMGEHFQLHTVSFLNLHYGIFLSIIFSCIVNQNHLPAKSCMLMRKIHLLCMKLLEPKIAFTVNHSAYYPNYSLITKPFTIKLIHFTFTFFVKLTLTDGRVLPDISLKKIFP